MTSWEAQTTAQDIAEGVVIHLDKGDPPVAPVNGERFVIYNSAAAKSFVTTIVSLAPGEIIFKWADQEWRAVPFPAAAPSPFHDARGQILIPLKIQVAAHG